ncbi:MAG TPA: crotonase/enoyl-CoA hydratase family protein [Polyangiaceae bacterium]|nr:crotonase/enoyl-CoA hydratase family protein [Polyangiaceae bacterium]
MTDPPVRPAPTTAPAIVKHTRQGDVLLVQMDDGKANALSPEMLSSLDAALAAAEKDAKALVLTGREGRFSAGFDLKHMMAGPDSARALVRQGAEVLMRLYLHPQPVVVACSGHALAGGALLVLCGDVRVGAQGAFKIGLNEVSIGMPLPILAHELARDRLDPRHFLAATLFAAQYLPERAVDVGYLDRLVEPEQLVPSAILQAEELTRLPAEPYALTKRSIRRGVAEHIRATVDANIREFTGG